MATAMAASRSGTRSTIATGPKISSCATGMSGGHAREHGRREAPAVAVGTVAPACTVAPCAARLLHLADELVALRLGHDRPDVRARVERVADHQRVHRLDEPGQELVGTSSTTMKRLAAMHDCPLFCTGR